MRTKLLLAVLLAGLAAALVSAPKSVWTQLDKAYYLDAREANFIRPGLVLRIVDAQVETDGTIRARFRITDPMGLPLDRDGVTTPGPVSVSLIAGFIPNDGRQYTTYTTRVQTSPINGVSATQAGTDANGTFEKLAEGEYRYTFRTKAPAGFDRTATHSIGAYSTRNLAEFDLPSNYSNNVFSFIPVGGEVKITRDVVRTGSCNKCHNPLSAHGGARQNVELCVMCHQPQTTDPDTGNTVDFPVMVHKIHMGKNLPSVQAGKPYRIIGFSGTIFDFSTVGFPSDARQCTVCHESGTPNSGKDDKAWFKPNRAACGACHDNVNFATGENHVDQPQISDNQCSNCHIPQGELEFDASILGAHTIPRFSRELPGTVFELVSVADGSPGKKPTVIFRIKDKSGKPILPSEMTSFSLVLAGPTSDYAGFVSEDARAAKGGTDGTYSYTLANAIPAGATGSFSVGMQGYRNRVLMAGTRKEMTVRDAGVNRVMHFSVDGSKVEPRRPVVDLAKCNSCHTSLSLHGDNRNRIEMCVLCHNPNQTDAARRPAAAGPPESVSFGRMIHRIHTGEESSEEYTVYGFGGTPYDFKEVLFPGDRRDCDKCHVNGSQQLPLNENLLPVANPRGWLNPIGPTAAACTGCHTGKIVASHALGMTNALGESCAVCHGPNADFAVNKAHAR